VFPLDSYRVFCNEVATSCEIFYLEIDRIVMRDRTLKPTTTDEVPMILGIEGSPRKGGNSHTMLKAILSGVHETDTIAHEVHLRDYRYEPCVGCEKCRKDKICTRFHDGMTLLNQN